MTNWFLYIEADGSSFINPITNKNKEQADKLKVAKPPTGFYHNHVK